MRKIVLVFGFIAGGIMSVMMFLSMLFHDQIGFNTAGYVVGYTSMVLAFLMVYFGVKSYRDNVAGGKVTFGKAFAVGVLITLVATCCYVATWEVIYHKMMPDFADKYAAYEVQKAKAAGATEEQIAARQKSMDDFKQMYANPLINVALTALEPLPVGLLFTLIAAGVLSRKRRTEGESVGQISATLG